MSSRYAYLSGFRSFRTPSNCPERQTVQNVRRCACGTVLAKDNKTDTCGPCTGTVTIPESFVVLAEHLGAVGIETLGAILRGGETRAQKIARQRLLYRTIREMYATGEWSQYQLAREFGLTRTGVKYILDRPNAISREEYEREDT